MSLIVDTTSVSYESIRNDLVRYLKTKPDYTRWKDFLESSSGTVLIELMAGLAAFLEYSIIANRRETYLAYAQNRSSVIAGAQTLGYSAYRGRNPVVRIRLLPSVTTTIAIMDVVGTYGDYDLLSLDNYALQAGVYSTIDVVVGNIKEESITIDSNSLQFFRFYSPDVSEDLALYLNDVYVPTVSSIENFTDILSGLYYLISSNVFGGIDAIYYNIASLSGTIGTADGVTTEFHGLLSPPIKPGSVILYHNSLSFGVDDGNGVMTGSFIDASLSQINYTTGEISLYYLYAPGRFTIDQDNVTLGAYPNSYLNIGLHGLETGTTATVSGSVPTGLTEGVTYYVRVRDDYSIFLCDTYAHAIDTESATGVVTLSAVESGSFDVMTSMTLSATYNPAYTYSTGDELLLKYVSLYRWTEDEIAGTTEDLVVSTSELTSTVGTIFEGAYDGITYPLIVTSFQDKETISSIASKAPIFHETQLVVRGRDDYKKLLQLLIPNCIDANGYDVSTSTVEVTYTRSVYTDTTYREMTMLTSEQKADLLTQLDVYRPFGVEQTTISDPIRVDCKLRISLRLVSGAQVTADTIEAAIASILSVYEKKLEQSLAYIVVPEYRESAPVDVYYLPDIEQSIEELSYVKMARVELIDGGGGSGSASLTELDWNEYYMMVYAEDSATEYPVIELI